MPVNVNVSGWKIPERLSLADSYFQKPRKIDLFIGAKTFFELIFAVQIKQSANYTFFQKGLAGQIVSGRYTPSREKTFAVNLSCQAESYIR